MLQYTINVGTGITNMILSGQILQSVYARLCTGGWVGRELLLRSETVTSRCQQHPSGASFAITH
jgi:hypothetical protein